MDNKRTQTLVLILLAVISLGGWLSARQVSSVSGFPLDDAWIHQTYARSLAAGEGWSFVPGVPSAGATAPLWVLLLVPGYWLKAAPMTWVSILAGLQLLAIGLLGAAAWRRMGLDRGLWAAAAGALLIFEWHLVWGALSGMETLFYGLFSLVVFVCLLSLFQQPFRSAWLWFGLGAFIGAGVWVRPEALTLLGPVGLTTFLLPGENLTSRIKRLAAAGGGFLLVFSAYLLFNHGLAGSWWPNTFYAKQAEYFELQAIPLVKRLGRQFSPLLAGPFAVLLPGLIVNLVLSLKRRAWAALSGGIWALGHVILYAWRLPVIYQHGRYVIPALPLLLLLGFAGYRQTFDLIKNSRINWLLSRAWGGMIAVSLLLFWILGLQSYLEDTAFIDGEMVQTAMWIQEHTAETDLIAAHDIGAIGYFTQRPIVDLAGLISPDVIPFIRNEARLAEYLNQACPRYLVTFPDWYGLLPDLGELIYQTDIPLTVELGGTNMAVYRWVGCP